MSPRTRLGHIWSLVFTVPVSLAITAGMIGLAVIYTAFDRREAARQWWFRSWSRMVLAFIGVPVDCRGAEALDPDGAYVFASNHASLIDIAVLVYCLPMHLRFFAKRELLKVPFIGTWLVWDKHLPLDRRDARAAMRSLTEGAESVRRNRLCVLLFPEGSRSLTGVQPFKDGAALLAIRAGVPLVPVAIRGTEEVLPAKSSYLRGGPVAVRIGAPLPTEGLEPKDRGRLTGELEARVRELYSNVGQASACGGLQSASREF